MAQSPGPKPRPVTVRTLAAQARDFVRPLERSMGQAPLHMHAQSTRLAGDYDDAAALFAESLELNRRLGDQGMVGDEQRSRELLGRAQSILDESGTQPAADDQFEIDWLREQLAARR